MVEYLAAAACFAIARLVYVKNEAKIKGWRGEGKLARRLRHLNIPGKVQVLRDSLFQTEWGGTSQVDAIAVTRYGIIVCEMKNYSAKVFGGVNEDSWSVKYSNSGKVHALMNPVKQNKTHVMAIESILHEKYPGMPYLPVTVFSDDAQLYVQNSRNKVCNMKALQKVIQRQLGPEILTDNQVREISGILKRNLVKGRRARKAHIAAIELKKDLNSNISAEELQEIKNAVIDMSKDKPVISREDTYYFSVSNNSEREKHVVSDQRPLYEILQDADRRSAHSEDVEAGQRSNHYSNLSH